MFADYNYCIYRNDFDKNNLSNFIATAICVLSLRIDGISALGYFKLKNLTLCINFISLSSLAAFCYGVTSHD